MFPRDIGHAEIYPSFAFLGFIFDTGTLKIYSESGYGVVLRLQLFVYCG